MLKAEGCSDLSIVVFRRRGAIGVPDGLGSSQNPNTELGVLPHLLRLPNGEGAPQNTVTERHGNWRPLRTGRIPCQSLPSHPRSSRAGQTLPTRTNTLRSGSRTYSATQPVSLRLLRQSQCCSRRGMLPFRRRTHLQHRCSHLRLQSRLTMPMPFQRRQQVGQHSNQSL